MGPYGGLHNHPYQPPRLASPRARVLIYPSYLRCQAQTPRSSVSTWGAWGGVLRPPGLETSRGPWETPPGGMERPLAAGGPWGHRQYL